MTGHLIAIPFHDWRKCVREGFRTRDAHLIEAFTRGGDFEKVLVVSRPITRIELALHREARDPGWNVILRGERWHVIHDSRGCYVFEYFDTGFLGQAMQGKSWFFKAYGTRQMTEALFEALSKLEMGQAAALAMNIRSASLASHLSERGIPVAFDAWDNWLRFPLGRREHGHVRASYAEFARVAPLWFTNSESNRLAFKSEFAPGTCTVVPNGVDLGRFQGPFTEPREIGAIPRPRAFFGGKVTHLFDADLFNDVTRRLGEVQFVLAGQIIDREVWGRINLGPNVHYLGDIHYEEYPAYVRSSDVCILPYVGEKRSHGANSIKLYEYVAAGCPTVSTAGNGANEMSQFVSIANSPEEFAGAIAKHIERGGVLSLKPLAQEFSWDERAGEMSERIRAMVCGDAGARGALRPVVDSPVAGIRA